MRKAPDLSEAARTEAKDEWRMMSDLTRNRFCQRMLAMCDERMTGLPFALADVSAAMEILALEWLMMEMTMSVFNTTLQKEQQNHP